MVVVWYFFFGFNFFKKLGIVFYLCFFGVCMIFGLRVRGIFKYLVIYLNSRIVYLFRYMIEFCFVKIFIVR